MLTHKKENTTHNWTELMWIEMKIDGWQHKLASAHQFGQVGKREKKSQNK